MEPEKTILIEKILEIELKMFLTVPVLEKTGCQEHPDNFRMTRKAQFITWSEQTLNSYLNDLTTAEQDNRNLMTHKYARMDDLVPRENNDPLIDRIVKVQYAWQTEMMNKYPALMGRARPLGSSSDTPFQTSFETYLRAELETYSHRTIAALYEDIALKQENRKNMTEELYDYMIKDLGYESLEEAEESAIG
jgi:hypothetical protein